MERWFLSLIQAVLPPSSKNFLMMRELLGWFWLVEAVPAQFGGRVWDGGIYVSLGSKILVLRSFVVVLLVRSHKQAIDKLSLFVR